MFALKRNVSKSFFQKSAILSSVEEDRFAFDMIDVNHNQQINAKEFSDFLTAFGEPISVQEAQMVISSVDKNGDNQLNFDEWHAANNQSLVLRDVEPWTEEDEQIFIMGDSNGDGLLTFTEYANLLKGMDPVYYGNVDEAVVQREKGGCDRNGDRAFTREELMCNF